MLRDREGSTEAVLSRLISPSALSSQLCPRQLPFADASFDTVVDTFSMCVLNEQATAALKEVSCGPMRNTVCPELLPSHTALSPLPRAQMRRVVRPGGSILLLEHSRSGFGPLGAYQDLTASAVAASGKGCFWNHDVEGAVVRLGFPAGLSRWRGGARPLPDNRHLMKHVHPFRVPRWAQAAAGLRVASSTPALGGLLRTIVAKP